MPLFRPRWIVPLALFWLVFALVAFSDTASDFLLSLLAFGFIFLWGLIWLVRILILLSRFIRARLQPNPPDSTSHITFSWKLLYMAVEPTTIALSLALILLNIPLGIRLKLSETALTTYVQEVRAGRRSLQLPGEPTRWVGLFAVKETELVEDGIVRLITAEDFIDHAGLVYSPQQQPPILGEDSYHHLYGSWWHWHRSW